LACAAQSSTARLKRACALCSHTHVFHLTRLSLGGSGRAGSAGRAWLGHSFSQEKLCEAGHTLQQRQLPTTNVLALATMKNAAKCDT